MKLCEKCRCVNRDKDRHCVNCSASIAHCERYTPEELIEYENSQEDPFGKVKRVMVYVVMLLWLALASAASFVMENIAVGMILLAVSMGCMIIWFLIMISPQLVRRLIDGVEGLLEKLNFTDEEIFSLPDEKRSLVCLILFLAPGVLLPAILLFMGIAG